MVPAETDRVGAACLEARRSAVEVPHPDKKLTVRGQRAACRFSPQLMANREREEIREYLPSTKDSSIVVLQRIVQSVMDLFQKTARRAIKN